MNKETPKVGSIAYIQERLEHKRMLDLSRTVISRLPDGYCPVEQVACTALEPWDHLTVSEFCRIYADSRHEHNMWLMERCQDVLEWKFERINPFAVWIPIMKGIYGK